MKIPKSTKFERKTTQKKDSILRQIESESELKKRKLNNDESCVGIVEKKMKLAESELHVVVENANHKDIDVGRGEEIVVKLDFDSCVETRKETAVKNVSPNEQITTLKDNSSTAGTLVRDSSDPSVTMDTSVSMDSSVTMESSLTMNPSDKSDLSDSSLKGPSITVNPSLIDPVTMDPSVAMKSKVHVGSISPSVNMNPTSADSKNGSLTGDKDDPISTAAGTCTNTSTERPVKRNQVVVGVNAVTRCLEQDKLRAGIVCLSAQPPLVTQHILLLSATRGCPFVAIPNLSEVLSPLLGIKSVLAIGFKVTIYIDKKSIPIIALWCHHLIIMAAFLMPKTIIVIILIIYSSCFFLYTLQNAF